MDRKSISLLAMAAALGGTSQFDNVREVSVARRFDVMPSMDFIHVPRSAPSPISRPNQRKRRKRNRQMWSGNCRADRRK